MKETMEDCEGKLKRPASYSWLLTRGTVFCALGALASFPCDTSLPQRHIPKKRQL